MKFETLVGKELYGSIIEARIDTGMYEEIVIPSKDILSWNTILADKLATPLISPDASIHDDHQNSLEIDAALHLAEPFGGIGDGQTLYHGTYESTVILIMIWPWQDNINITLKKAIL